MAHRRLEEDLDLSTMAGRLQFAMDQRHTNASKIERATGMARQTVYLMLGGKTAKPSWDILVQLCEYLGVRPEWLADGKGPMHPSLVLKEGEESELVRFYRQMSPQHQRDLAKIARQWAEEDDDGPSTGYPLPRPPRHQQ